MITIGSLIEQLGRTGKFTAKQILAETKQVFPQGETSLKSIYSTCSRANISLPGSNKSVVNVEAYKALMLRLNPPAEQKKTGTDGK